MATITRQRRNTRTAILSLLLVLGACSTIPPTSAAKSAPHSPRVQAALDSILKTEAKEGGKNGFQPRSQVVLRVENYLYERKQSNNSKDQLTPQEEEDLKMVLLQELHEERSDAAASVSHGGDGDDNSTEVANLGSSNQNSTTTTTRFTATYHKHVNHPLQRAVRKIWGKLDEMDRMIVSSTLPLAALMSLMPLVATSDLFWVNQLGDALAVSAQSAANMAYQFVFGLFNFLPSVTATLVSQHYANGDLQGTQQVIGQAMLFAISAAAIASSLLFLRPSNFLGAVLNADNPALALSIPYLRIRSLSLIPQMISFVAFSAFRGTMDLKSCVKISVLSNGLNMALTPILIHVFRLGISGSALTALTCDCMTALSYVMLMRDRNYLIPSQIFKVPSWEKVAPIVKGSALQVKSFALLFTNLLVTRKVQSLGEDGVAPAAYALAMQTFFMGSVVIYAMGMAIQTLYPTAVANSPDHHRTEFRRVLVQRLLNRGFLAGLGVTLVQCLLAPGILKSTPLQTVRQAAIVPIMIVVAFQAVHGLTAVGDGIIIGSGRFALSSAVQVVASLAYIACLRFTPKDMGLNGVFVCLGAFTLFRLAGVLAILPTVIKDAEQHPDELKHTSSFQNATATASAM